ncbi:MAG: hypothetical protein ACREQN_04130 [Candidatus Binataceae bacterium]
MESFKTLTVTESELDMDRRTAPTGNHRISRLIFSLLRFPESLYSPTTPRRSIDREVQQDSPYFE